MSPVMLFRNETYYQYHQLALIARFMGQHGTHLGPTGPRWAPCWLHELCYLGGYSLWLRWERVKLYLITQSRHEYIVQVNSYILFSFGNSFTSLMSRRNFQHDGYFPHTFPKALDTVNYSGFFSKYKQNLIRLLLLLWFDTQTEWWRLMTGLCNPYRRDSFAV